MKLIKTAGGKKTIKLSKSEWQSIGKKAGWMKTAFKSNTLGIYKRWLEKIPPQEQITFVDDIYEMAEANYGKGGDAIVEAMTPEEVIEEFKSVEDAKEYIGIRKGYSDEISDTAW